MWEWTLLNRREDSCVGPVKKKGLSQKTRTTFMFVDGTQKVKLSKTRAKLVRGLLRYLWKNSDNTGTVSKAKHLNRLGGGLERMRIFPSADMLF